jgi:hypothetical protein
MAWVRVVHVTRDGGKGGTATEMMNQAALARGVLQKRSGFRSVVFYGDGSGDGWSISVWDDETKAKAVDSHPDVTNLHNNKLKPKIKDEKIDISYYEAF